MATHTGVMPILSSWYRPSRAWSRAASRTDRAVPGAGVRRSAADAQMEAVFCFLSCRLEGGCGRIGPGQELVETALGMAVDDAADHVSQIGPGLDPDQLAGLNQRCNHRPVRGSAVRARKESIFPGEGQRAHA